MVNHHYLPALLLLMFMPTILFTACDRDTRKLPECFDLQGHRGAMGLAPENTIPGFLKSVDLGVMTIEFDLAVSNDHKLVISHEPWFRSDICLQPDGSPIPQEEERSYRLYDRRYVEIEQYDCGSLQNPNHPNQQTERAVKPLMTEAIMAIEEYVRSQDRPPVRYNIEIKSDEAWDNRLTPEPEVFARLVHEEFLTLQEQLEVDFMKRVNVQSFDPRSVTAFRDISPTIPIAILVYSEESVDDHIETFGFLPEIYSPNYGVLTPEHVARAHELGMRVIPWTVNNPEDMETLIGMGVDGLITDYPNRFNERYPDYQASSGNCGDSAL